MNTIVILIFSLLQVYSFIVVARVLMTWLPNLDYHNPIVRFLIQATEPFLKPIRQMLPPASGLDFSPMVLLVGIFLIRMLLSNLLY
jgi:YggT family protein